MENVSISSVLFVAVTVALDSTYATGASARPGLNRIQASTGLARDTVVQCLRVNEELGWLIVVEQGTRGGKATRYQLAIGRPFAEMQTPPDATPALRRPSSAELGRMVLSPGRPELPNVQGDESPMVPEPTPPKLTVRQADDDGVIYPVGEQITAAEYKSLSPQLKDNFSPSFDEDVYECNEAVISVWYTAAHGIPNTSED